MMTWQVRALLVTSCQKIFFERGRDFYHYGPIEMPSGYGRGELDLQLATSAGEVAPSVSREKRGGKHTLLITDRVYEYHHLRAILTTVFASANGARFKSDDAVLNLMLLSLQLD